MESIAKFLTDNKEWLFSGVGVVIVVGILKFFFTSNRPEASQDNAVSKVATDPSQASEPRLVTLPNGESIEVEGIDGIIIAGRTGLLNVCLVWKRPGGKYQKAIYYTYSRRKAERFARETAEAINSVRQ
jgi:hypothetical protein